MTHSQLAGGAIFMGLFAFSGVTAAMAIVIGGAAQSAPVPAQIETRVSLWSMSDYGGRNDLLRRAKPHGDIVQWLDESDPLVARVLAMPNWSGVISARMTLGPNGRATACEVAEPPHGLQPEAVAGLCERLAPRVQYRPALTAEGEAAEDRVRVLIRFSQYRLEDAARMPMIRAEPLPPSPPAPMVGPGWPPLVAPGNARLAGGLALLEGGGDSPSAMAAPWAGIEVQLDESGAASNCRIIASSEDSRHNQQACVAARRANYALDGATSQRDRRLYLLVVRENEQLRTLPHVRGGRSAPILDPASATALATEWAGRAWPRIFVSVDASGAPTDCRINESSGDDVIDVEACQTVRRLARFSPARDGLDRPAPGSLFMPAPSAPH